MKAFDRIQRQKALVSSLNAERQRIASMIKEKRRVDRVIGHSSWMRHHGRGIKAYFDGLVPAKHNNTQSLKRYMNEVMERAFELDGRRGNKGLTQRDKYVINECLKIAEVLEERITILNTLTRAGI